MPRLAAFAVLAAAFLAAPGAGARIAPSPTAELGAGALLAPDGSSVLVSVIASCPERWTLVQARVTASQPGASGTASFPLACIGSRRPFQVSIPAETGTFALGPVDLTAVVTAQRGKPATASDAGTLELEPTISVDFAPTARILGGGSGLELDVTAACPVGATGETSSVGVSQGNTTGGGSFTPVCDGAEHTFRVTLGTFQGTFVPGDARALSFGTISYDGRSFTGVGDRPVQLVR